MSQADPPWGEQDSKIFRPKFDHLNIGGLFVKAMIDFMLRAGLPAEIEAT
jgi:hypothetical protein